MKKIFVIICAAALTLAGCAQQEKKTEDTPLAYAAEPDGFKVVEFDQVFGDVRMMGVSELHSMIVMQHGEVIYEKYAVGQDPDYLHILWSASKTFTATAIGFAVQDGLLSVDDKVLKFFPDEAPAEQSEWLKALSVKDLLTMSSGIRKDYLCPIEAHRIKSPVDSILAEPFIFEPGSVFRYNSVFCINSTFHCSTRNFYSTNNNYVIIEVICTGYTCSKIIWKIIPTAIFTNG